MWNYATFTLNLVCEAITLRDGKTFDKWYHLKPSAQPRRQNKMLALCIFLQTAICADSHVRMRKDGGDETAVGDGVSIFARPLYDAVFEHL